MGFKSISDYDADPLFQSMVAVGVVDESVFGFKLSDSGAELFLGGTNSDLYTGDFTYVPVTEEGYWQVEMGGFDVDDQSVVGTMTSIIDTGTTLIISDSTSAQAIYSQISGSQSIGDGLYSSEFLSIPDCRASLTWIVCSPLRFFYLDQHYF